MPFNTNQSINHASLTETVMGAIYGYYVKYQTLNPISYNAFAETKADTLTVIIDLNDICIHVDRFLKEINTDFNAYAISAGVINMCAHYREFYSHSFQVNTKFFIVGNSFDAVNESLLCGEYIEPRMSPQMLQLLSSNIKMLNMICAYIPEVYTIFNAGYDFNAVAYDISRMDEINKSPVMVVSKDVTTWLLAPYGINILRPKKYGGDDTSFILTQYNAFDTYMHFRTKAVATGIASYYECNKLLVLLCSITGLPSRGIKSTRQISSAASDILTLASDVNSPILNDYNIDINTAMTLLNTLRGRKMLDNACIERFRALDPSYMGASAKMSGRFDEAMRMVDLYDPEHVRDLDSKYFADCHLDVMVL